MHRKRRFELQLLFCFCLLVLESSTFFAGEHNEVLTPGSQHLAPFVPDSAVVNVGDMSLRIYATGRTGNHPKGAQSVTFPRGTANVVYLDGFVWGGKVEDTATPKIRVGGHTWSPGTVPGSIIAPGVAEDFKTSSVNRVWRVRRDYFEADLRDDAADLFIKSPGEVTAAEILGLRERYARDWSEWPWQKGAPFYDANGDGNYTPQFNPNGSPKLYPEADEPGLADADQVVWLVINDLDEPRVQNLYGSPPIGIEAQITLWAYDRDEALNNIIFKRYRLIYKGTGNTSATARIDSMHIAQWSDPDLGDAGDDLVGCDTLLNVGYVYNATTEDRSFQMFGLPAPAFGYDLLGGPLVREPGSEAVFDMRAAFDFKHLRMTHFSFSATGDPWNEPFRGSDYRGTLQWWNVLRGYRSLPENPPFPWIDYLTDKPTKFMYSGDPVTGVGTLDSNAGNRLMYITSGPFDMAAGDTNEVTIALVGGVGSDRLMSITAMKYYDRIAQQYFNDLFNVPQAAAAPGLSATELNGQILLNWGDSQPEVERVEKTALGDFVFEGYNVYQLPESDTKIEGSIRLATYDEKNEITAVVEEYFDIASGTVLTRVVQDGRNTGLSRTFQAVRDSLHGEPLYNGQTYHFAVTAYYVNPDRQAPVRALESAPSVVSVTPQWLKPGRQLQAAIHDTIPVVHEQGVSDGLVLPLVVDPTRVSGDDYRVVFTPRQRQVWYIREPRTFWHLINTTTGDTVLRQQRNQSGDDDYLVVDGIQVKVFDVGEDYARTADGNPAFIEIANDAGPLTAADFDEQGLPYGGNLVWHDINSASATDRYMLSTISSDESRLLTQFDKLVPQDFELRFTDLENGSWGWWFWTDETARVPFQLWDIGSATPDDLGDDVRMIPRMFQGEGTLGQYTADHGPDGAFGLPSFDRIYWHYPVDGETYEDYEQDAQDGALDDYHHIRDEVIGRLLVVDADGDGMPPRPGTVIRIFSSKPFSPHDVFTFSTADYAPTFSESEARKDVESINVFPNPYLGRLNLSNRFAKSFVTFTHLPETATIRIFTIAGSMVRRLEKNDPGQFLEWDLRNASGKYVANGIYVAHVEMPELAVEKVLRLVVLPN